MVIVLEFWRHEHRSPPDPLKPLRLNIPSANPNHSGEVPWEAPIGDDPVTDWSQDVVGRTAIVELLAEHALRLRTPVIALNGGLGDGKSSVLNLLRSAVEGQAVVVGFSAWLPGSEATLAADLFKDIATECRKIVIVPQLRKRVLALARSMSGSLAYLGGFKDLIPAQSQRDEIKALHDAFARVPMPILVLLDEVDRMRKDEIVVLLKILRGVSSFPNVTFVCAFSAEEIRRELQKQGGISYEYLEKFFPVSVNLSPPPAEMIGKCVRFELSTRLEKLGWFRNADEQKIFADFLDQVWADGLQKICTNLRKAGVLANDVFAAGPSLAKVNAIDLILIETVRRFYPTVYQTIKSGAEYLTDARHNQFFSKEKGSEAFFSKLNGEIDACHEPQALRIVLFLLFPEYAKSSDQVASVVSSSRRPGGDERSPDERRICSADYFQIYFRNGRIFCGNCLVLRRDWKAPHWNGLHTRLLKMHPIISMIG